MKIRSSFVTNSSSTSYIISLKKGFGRDSFMKAIGSDGGSPMNRMFEQLFDAIQSEHQEIHKAASEYQCESVEELLDKTGFDKNTISTVEGLLKNGRTVYFGEFHSDGETASERYFCCNSFVLSDDEIYFNGNISGW